MSIDPITGLNTINNILSMLRLPKIAIDTPYIKFMTQHLIARELNMLFRQLRRGDVKMHFENLDAMEDEELDKICFARGINLN